MDNKSIGRVSEQERDRIRDLYLRKNGLNELFSSLSKLDQHTLDTSPLYERIVRDMGSTSVTFQEWWDSMAQTYGWEKREGRRWRIDFGTCEVYYED